MDPEDLLASDQVGEVDIDLPVEPTRAKECAVKDVGAIGGRDDDDTLGGVEAVHLHKKGIESLLALVVAAAQAGAALAAHRVDLIDEDEAGGALAALLEHVAHARGAHADEHLHEVRARNAEERDIRLAGDRLGEERLAGARGTDHQDALGNASAHPGELLRVLEEFDDLGDLFLRLIASGDVGEGDLVAVAGQELGAALSEAERTAARLTELADEQEVQETDDEDKRDDVEGDRVKQRRILGLRELARVLELLEVGIRQPAGGAKFGGLLLVIVLEERLGRLPGDHDPHRPARGISVNGTRLDLPVAGGLDHLVDRDVRGRGRHGGRPPKQRQHQPEEGEPEQKYFGLEPVRREVLEGTAGLLVLELWHQDLDWRTNVNVPGA